MTELEKIKAKYQNKAPFVVPENYFENFNKEMVDTLSKHSIKQKPRATVWSIVQPIIYVAATVAIAMWSISLILDTEETSPAPDGTQIIALDSEHEVEAVSLNMVIDDYSLYEYLNENDEQN